MTAANAPRRPIYLDHQATTPTDPRVTEAMLPWFREKFGNPASPHAYGAEAEKAVETARAEIAALIGAEPREIVFTSGATEANNLAIKGAVRFKGAPASRVVTFATEHKCVLESVEALRREGAEISVLPVERDGLVDLARLAEAIGLRTVLVSVMAANNEIGVVQPVAEIGALCRSRGVLFHTDAAQAAGKVPIDVGEMGIDLLSISGHKLYGPMGVGALYVRRRPRVRLEPLFSGGGQERGFRSGTLPTPLCVALGVAIRIAREGMDEEGARLRGLRDRLHAAIRAQLPDVVLNGDAERRLPGNLNLSFPGVDARDLIPALGDIAVSSGSACTAASVEPSYVLRALGVDDRLAAASIRFGLGRWTSAAEIDYAAEQVVRTVVRLRAAGTGATGFDRRVETS
jgi:cysteine desulfurase